MFGVRSRFKRGVECAKGSSCFCLCRTLKEFGADHDGCLGDCLNDETNDVKDAYLYPLCGFAVCARFVNRSVVSQVVSG